MYINLHSNMVRLMVKNFFNGIKFKGDLHSNMVRLMVFDSSKIFTL